jgi:CHAT domain-containing protein/tetratricopeptide (TPR) repeat protein
VRRSRLALFFAVLSLTTPAVLGGAGEQGEILLPGQVRERPIAGGETHVYQVEVADAPLLITVEQRGIDLVVEVQGLAGRLASNAGDLRWQSEVLLLEGPGEHRLEVHSREITVPPAHYAIRVEALPESSDSQRAAFSLMSRAGQEAFERTPEARHRAVTSYREALAQWRALGAHRWEAETLSAIAGLEQEIGELRLAVEDYQHALTLWRDLADPHREATTLNELGWIRVDIGEFAAARESLQSALTLRQRLGERFEEVETRSNLCYLEHKTGALPEALACYKETLAFFHEVGDSSQEARMLNNIGGVEDLMGEPDSALEYYERALALWRKLGERLEEARLLNNIAVVHRALGEWQEALRVYGQVREIVVALGDRPREVTLLNNVGFTYNSLGEPQRALSFLKDALTLRREIGDRRGEVITLNNLGSTWRNLGDLKKAIDYHQQALDLTAVLGDHRQEAVTRVRLAEVQLERGDSASALRGIEPALAFLKETGIRHAELQASQLRGRALIQAGRPREALPVLQEVVERQRTLRDRTGEAEALQALAAAERSLGLMEESQVHAELAVTRVEELRKGFVSPNLRAAFLATQRRAYSLLTDLLMDRHAAEPGGTYDQAAFVVSERARARSLLDVLYSGNAVRIGGSLPGELLERRRSLHYRLSAKADQQVRKRSTGDEETEAQEREIQSLLAELDSVEAEIRRLDPQYAAVSMPPSLTVREVAGLLDSGTLLLEYSLGQDRSYLWAISAESFRSFMLPPQQEIETLARRLHEELSTLEAGARRGQDMADELSRILLGQIWPEVSRYRRLVVVPDAALHLLPFSVLPAPGSGKLLLEQLEVDYLPSATTLAQQRQRLEHRPPAAKWAAVFADPVFTLDDPRLTVPTVPAAVRPAVKMQPQRGGETDDLLPVFERLPASGQEAKDIATLAPAGQVWMALNLDANREAVLSGKLRDYRVVHFATHAIADTRNPELSGLVLSLVDNTGRPREGFLGLSDIYELDLAADLVVLSGCRTALGREVRGEGIMGLTRGFLYAGVPRVVASLWRVQDRTTAELMKRFYRALWRDGLPAAAALRRAQQSLRHDPRHRDTRSWAGFVFQGDWR